MRILSLVLAAATPVLALSIACGESTPAKSPTTNASASAAPLPVPGDAPDPPAASLFDPRDGGSPSDCVPAVRGDDGTVAAAVLSRDAERVSMCLAYATPHPEAPAGRACYEVDLGQGIFDRVAPFGGPLPQGDAPLAAWLASHASAAAPEASIKQSGGGDVQVCKGSDCRTVRAEGYKPVAMKDACLPAPLASNLPADVSPDGETLFVVRHESCSAAAVFGETYDVKSGKRTARFPLQTDAVVDLVAWIGARVLVRSCTADEKACSIWLVDPKAAAHPNAHGYTNAVLVPKINTIGFDRFYFRAADDLWAMVDRLGGDVAWVKPSTAHVESSVELSPGPDVDRPYLASTRAQPQPQLVLVYGATGRVVLIDLSGMRVAGTYRPPVCGERI